MDEKERLTPKQESFCVHYTTIGAETFGNGTRAAIAAGYSDKSAHVQACALLRKPKIQQRVRELHSENMGRNMITVDKVLADLEHDKLAARQAGQYGVARGCTELQGKYLAMFIDRHMSEDVDKRREYSEVEQIEAHRIAAFLLTSKAQAPPAQLMAEDVEEDNS